MIKGIDVSKFQGGLKITDAKKAGFDFVIIRGGLTGYGSNRPKIKDIYFEDFYKQCKAAEMPCGVYYYSCATNTQEGINEAKFLYEKCLKGKRFEYPIYVDVENEYWQADDKSGVTDAVIGFCDTLEKLGYFAGVYASLSWFNTKLDTARLNRFTKWVAAWSKEKPAFKYNAFDLWQNSDSGVIGKHIVDTDIAYKDFPSVIKSAGKNGYKTVEAVAKEVIAGKWGAGSERRQKLTAAGYDYEAVQKAVNEMLMK